MLASPRNDEIADKPRRIASTGQGALGHLDRVIVLAPQREGFLETARALDQVSLALARLKPAARAAWQAILDVVPTSQEAAARLGRLAREDGDHSLAVALLERAV